MHYILQSYNYNLSDPESIPSLFLKHLSLVGIVMLISLIIAIPVGILVARYRRLYFPVISVSGLLYTIPSIAAFGLLIRIATVTTVGIAALASLVGQSTLGDLVFQNIVFFDFDAIAAGAILTAVFAIAADLLLLALQIVLNRGRSAVSIA